MRRALAPANVCPSARAAPTPYPRQPSHPAPTPGRHPAPIPGRHPAPIREGRGSRSSSRHVSGPRPATLASRPDSKSFVICLPESISPEPSQRNPPPPAARRIPGPPPPAPGQHVAAAGLATRARSPGQRDTRAHLGAEVSLGSPRRLCVGGQGAPAPLLTGAMFPCPLSPNWRPARLEAGGTEATADTDFCPPGRLAGPNFRGVSH
jgi:hypothetical protein